MKGHLIKDKIYNFLFFKDHLVYFYIFFCNIVLLFIVNLPVIFWGVAVINGIVWPFISSDVTNYLVLFFKLFEPFKFVFNVLGEFIFGPMMYFSFAHVLSISFFFPAYTIITLIFSYIQKDRFINTTYYQLFKGRLIGLFEYNFTRYFLLFFSILVLYLLVCLCSLFLCSLKLVGFYSYNIIDQVEVWLFPFLYSLLDLFFCWLFYCLYVVQYNRLMRYLFIVVILVLFLSIVMVVPVIFLWWKGGIYHYDGSYNGYVIYKLFRYFIIYPIVVMFLITITFFLFLFIIKKK